MADNITPFPSDARAEWLCGPYSPEWRVVIEGREIPRLTGFRQDDGRVTLIVDRRFMVDYPDDEIARSTAWLLAQALAIGAGYSHLGATSKERPFAALVVEFTP